MSLELRAHPLWEEVTDTVVIDPTLPGNNLILIDRMVLVLDGLIDLVPVPELDAQLLGPIEVPLLKRIPELLDRLPRLLCWFKR